MLNVWKRLIVSLVFVCGACGVTSSTPQDSQAPDEIISSSIAMRGDPCTDYTAESVVRKKVTFPMTIRHAYGRTTIRKKPKRVATVGWQSQDIPLALGVVHPMGNRPLLRPARKSSQEMTAHPPLARTRRPDLRRRVVERLPRDSSPGVAHAMPYAGELA